jgi:hypothetical protein
METGKMPNTQLGFLPLPAPNPLFPLPPLAHDLNTPDSALKDDHLLGSHFDKQLIGIVPTQDAGDRLALCRSNGDLLPQELGDELMG